MDNETTIASTGPTPVSRKKRNLKLGGIAAFVILSIAAPVWGLKVYATSLKSIPPADTTSTAECAVVLTGGSGRVREGIALLSHRQVKKLIVSGVHQHSTLADMFPEILFYPEINLEDVILERRSSSTAGNAQHSLAIVEALKCNSILLVTSDYHMFRALKTFKNVFPPTVAIISYPVTSNRLLQNPTTFIDTGYWGAVFDEFLKFGLYSLLVF